MLTLSTLYLGVKWLQIKLKRLKILILNQYNVFWSAFNTDLIAFTQGVAGSSPVRTARSLDNIMISRLFLF